MNNVLKSNTYFPYNIFPRLTKYIIYPKVDFRYKRSLITGADRLNIDGTVGGVVTSEETRKAIKDLSKLEKIRQAKLGQERAV